MDNTLKFSGKAENYVKARPDYPNKLFDFLKLNYGINKKSVFADIGAGTGIFTKKLLEYGCSVFAVEPNSDMRKALKAALGKNNNLTIVEGSDKSTKLSDNSVDFVCAAQAFHWFDADLFKKECNRILKPDGFVILVWNTRKSDSKIVRCNAEVCKKYCPEFTGFSGGKQSSHEKTDQFFGGNYKLVKFQNDLEYDKDKFISRMLSASYSLTENDKNYSEYIKALNEFFNKYKSNDGILYLPNETLAYIGKIN